MEQNDLQRALMAVLFAAGEPVDAKRLSQTLECDETEIHEACKALMDDLSFNRSGIRIVRLEDAYQMCSSPEMAEYVTKTLETRKPPKLSPSQLETLTVIAYYQPATKALVEQIRGVDSAYCVSALVTKKLIRECGPPERAGRPIVYETTPDFLRVFGLESLSELPEIERSICTLTPHRLSRWSRSRKTPRSRMRLHPYSRRSRYDVDMVDDAPCDLRCPRADRLYPRWR